MSGGNVPRIALWIISELKSNDFLKTDGQNCCALLLGLRNDFYLQQINALLPNSRQICIIRSTPEAKAETMPRHQRQKKVFSKMLLSLMRWIFAKEVSDVLRADLFWRLS